MEETFNYTIDGKKIKVVVMFRLIYLKIEDRVYPIYFEPLYDHDKKINERRGIELHLSDLKKKHGNLNDDDLKFIEKVVKHFLKDTDGKKQKSFLEVV